MLHALRKFEDNSRVGLMWHDKYIARERLLMSWKYSRVTPVVHFVLTSNN